VGSAARRWFASLLLAGALLAGGSAAEAHPHVWVTARSELVYAPDGSLTGVRYAWTFDDMFSSYALQGVETRTKGVYTREELAPLAQTNVEALKEFDYFSFAKADGKKQQFVEPVDYFMDAKDGLLTLHFMLPLKTPVRSRELSLDVYDPTFFVDFKLADQEGAKLVGAPATCQLRFQRPADGAATAQTLGEQSFADGGNLTFGVMFANKITVNCP
jgi:ABC-type uncharacterized transport system substrate-binding protein